MSRQGWECPNCGRVMSPDRDDCPCSSRSDHVHDWVRSSSTAPKWQCRICWKTTPVNPNPNVITSGRTG